MNKLTPTPINSYLDIPPKQFIRSTLLEGRRKGFSQRFYVAYKFNRYTEHYERLYTHMARKKGTNSYSQDYWFASCRIDPAKKKDVSKWINETLPDVDQVWGIVLQQGWKQSITYDSSNDCFIGSLTCTDSIQQNYGCVITSRAGNPTEAIMLSYYKLLVVFENGTIPQDRVSDNWG